MTTRVRVPPPPPRRREEIRCRCRPPLLRSAEVTGTAVWVSDDDAIILTRERDNGAGVVRCALLTEKGALASCPARVSESERTSRSFKPTAYYCTYLSSQQLFSLRDSCAHVDYVISFILSLLNLSLKRYKRPRKKGRGAHALTCRRGFYCHFERRWDPYMRAPLLRRHHHRFSTVGPIRVDGQRERERRGW